MNLEEAKDAYAATKDAAKQAAEQARRAHRLAQDDLKAARLRLSRLMAEAEGIKVGDRIMILDPYTRRRKEWLRAFVACTHATVDTRERFDYTSPREWVLKVEYRKVRKDGLPYVNAASTTLYPDEWRKGWDI